MSCIEILPNPALKNYQILLFLRILLLKEESQLWSHYFQSMACQSTCSWLSCYKITVLNITFLLPYINLLNCHVSDAEHQIFHLINTFLFYFLQFFVKMIIIMQLMTVPNNRDIPWKLLVWQPIKDLSRQRRKSVIQVQI